MSLARWIDSSIAEAKAGSGEVAQTVHGPWQAGAFVPAGKVGGGSLHVADGGVAFQLYGERLEKEEAVRFAIEFQKALRQFGKRAQ